MLKKSWKAALVALFVGLIAFVTVAPVSAYPDLRMSLTVDRDVLYGGQHFTGTATSNVPCDWTLSWNGVTRTHHADDFVTTYTAPIVHQITRIPLHGTCVYVTARAVAPRALARAAAGTATWQRTIVITVLPQGSSVSPPGLPNTGGPGLAALIFGILLSVAGAVVMLAARRSRGTP
jgi:hypothetical protein